MDIQEQLGLLKIHLLKQQIMEEVEADELINTIMNAGLSQHDINSLIQDISNVSGMPVISATRVKVEIWRKIIIKFMLAGIAAATIERYIPGVYYTLYETLSMTIASLLKAGISKVDISGIINNPTSIIPSIPNTSGMMTSLTNGLSSGFLMAATIMASCISMACSLTQNITELLTIDNMKLTARLAAQLAVPGGISYAFQVLKGDFDGEIANLIDKNVVQQILNNTSDKVSYVKQTIAVAFAESAENVNNMKTEIKWSDLVPDRRMQPSTTRTINNEIEKTIKEIFSDPIILQKISKDKFLNDMLNIFKAENKIKAVESFKTKYYEFISPGIFRLLEILFAEPATLKPGKDSYSQPTDSVSEPVVVLNRSNSMLPGIGKEAWPGSTISKFNTKSNVKRFDASVEKERLRKAGLLPEKIVLGTHQPIDEQDNKFVYDVLIMGMNENGTGNIYTAIQERFQDPNVQDQIIDFIRQNQMLNFEDPNYASDIDRVSEIVRSVISSGNLDLLKRSGGRRYKKSRHYKRRRMTQRKRTTKRKGRRTLKGKKMRSTKRKR